LAIPAATSAGSYHVYVILDRDSTANQGSNTGNDIVSTALTINAASDTGLAIGVRVDASPRSGADGILVRSAPPQLMRVPGSDKDYDQSPGVYGTIVSGPSIGTAGGFTGNWWKVDWDAGINGWSADSVLAVAPSAGDIARPDFASGYFTNSNIFWNSGFAPISTNPSTPKLGAALGNCTWYAYGRMLQLGYSSAQLANFNNDAQNWATDAHSHGILVDNAPAVGAIAQSVAQDHVAVVESVNTDGTITVSESSYTSDASSPWNFLWRHRTVAPSWFDNYIHVLNAAPFASLSNGVLTVNGTPGNDTIAVFNDNAGNYTVTENGLSPESFSIPSVQSIMAFGFGGNDQILVKRGVNAPASLYGGAGNDTLLGRNGHDYLNGGTSNDSIQGLNGNDTLYGGQGFDTLTVMGSLGGANLLQEGQGAAMLLADEGFADTLLGGTGSDTAHIDFGGIDSIPNSNIADVIVGP
jgi:Ca2+-binding RTX toxin-like protein